MHCASRRFYSKSAHLCQMGLTWLWPAMNQLCAWRALRDWSNERVGTVTGQLIGSGGLVVAAFEIAIERGELDNYEREGAAMEWLRDSCLYLASGIGLLYRDLNHQPEYTVDEWPVRDALIKDQLNGTLHYSTLVINAYGSNR